MKMRSIITIVAVVAGVPAPAPAQDPVKTVPVRFAKGASSAVMKGSVKGYATVNYTVSARAGQTMTVRLTTSSRSSYFNVTAPGADAAMYNGSISGDRFTTTVPSTGTYVVQVYLMRNAARRNEVANYTMNIAVS